MRLLLAICAVMACTGIEAHAEVAPRLSVRHNAWLIALAQHLLPGDPSLADELRLAVNRPDSYCRRFRERFAHRVSCKPAPTLPWMVLVVGLESRGRSVEIDWKDAWEDVAHEIDKLLTDQPPDPKRWTWVDTPEWREKYPDQLFPEIGARLFQKGLALLSFNILSSSAPLIVLPLGRLEKAVRLAKLAGYGKKSQGYYSLVCYVPRSSGLDLSECPTPPVSDAQRPHSIH